MTVLLQHRRPPIPTKVFDSYWYLAAERQRMFRARLRGEEPPVTVDPILSQFKFTNAYRASDRTSQFLIRRVIYDEERGWPDTFLRILLFKLFNKMETWELICTELGEPSLGNFDPDSLSRVLERALGRGTKIYSAAYIIPSPTVLGRKRKHDNHLRLIVDVLNSRLHRRIESARSMEEAFDLLVSLPSIGTFLGYQLATDMNYAPHLAFSEEEFVVPGPGAQDGLAKCFSDLGDWTQGQVMRWTMETQHDQFASRGIAFDDLWDRPLQLIDCQNLFCEVDKYARVAHPEFGGRSGRKRIKQRFRPRREPVTAWYPPKWGINSRIKAWLASRIAPHR